ncbi:MAG: 16S rRNA (cytidine(1402)-2'-O)-methyltransferase [Oscillospiraceae bacterium]
MSGKLYVVGTPIGNLGDFSPRAVETLSNADFIAAEDTRVTVKLLNKFDIKKPMISYHEHNKLSRHGEIAERILSGEICALVTDAGMPAISDPGEDLVRLCLQNGIEVESVPGPSALITALAISGMPSGRFCFEGFLSMNKQSRREHLEDIKNEKRTLIFYEAPHKLAATLRDMSAALGDREVAIIRELTKLHETIEKTTLTQAAKKYSEISPKGEYVLIIEGAEPVTAETETSLEDACDIARGLMKDSMPASAAARRAAAQTGLKKGDIYKAIVEEKE